MKLFAGILTIVIAIWLTANIKNEITRFYDYQNKYASYWELADKSSTIEEKSRYIDKFVERLESSGLNGSYNAIIYPTPTNSFDYNLNALKSLQARLQEIKTMDVRSFEYQTAIQQITGQEQGEAREMLSELQGSWNKVHYFYYWDWIGVINWSLLIVALVFLFIVWFVVIDDL